MIMVNQLFVLVSVCTMFFLTIDDGGDLRETELGIKYLYPIIAWCVQNCYTVYSYHFLRTLCHHFEFDLLIKPLQVGKLMMVQFYDKIRLYRFAVAIIP
jgi:hypothetical protein